MKLSSSLFLTVLLIGTAFADPPRSQSPTRYKDLYLNSAFTDPPPEEEKEVIPSDLPDWVLVGLSKYVDGTKVKLMNKKDRSRVTIPSAEATEMGFSIEEVKQDRNFIDDAVVTVRKGNTVGDVHFDPQFLVLKKVAGGPPAANPAAAAAAAARAKAAGKSAPAPKIPVPTPNGNSPSSLPGRPPSPGTVPKPATAPSTQQRPSSSRSSSSRKGRWAPPSRTR